ncbi:MAG: universal stress protein [Anaerovoracaceae bacterium]|jgi:K+-sensing histidine kinase KdpD
MKNVLVCVTQQKTCDRLIRYGKELAEGEGGELFIVHIASYDLKFLGQSEDGDALEYLYQKSLEYGANLTVVRSNKVLATLSSMIDKNDISKVVMGESREKEKNRNKAASFEQMLRGRAQLIIVLPEEDDEDEQL